MKIEISEKPLNWKLYWLFILSVCLMILGFFISPVWYIVNRGGRWLMEEIEEEIKEDNK